MSAPPDKPTSDEAPEPGSAPEPGPAMPERLGIYRIESLLGRGGMGEVYLARDEVLERHVAIKRIRGDRLGNAARQARFLREARAVARLDHPCIVRIHHVLETQGNTCLVMEYVRGRDLSELPLGDMPLDRTLALALSVAEGLAAAHAQGLIHRDLKPSNVMSTSDGGVRILDFGLAKLREDDETKGEADEREKDLTGSGVLLGTAYAMSPEQVLRGEGIDHRSDLFAFGSLLYHMLAGRPPFRGHSVIDTLHRVVKRDPIPVEHVVADLPVALSLLVRELLSKKPDDRPPSAGAVAERLGRILDALPGGRPKTVAARSAALEQPSAALAEVSFEFRSSPSLDALPGAAASGAVPSDAGPVVRTVVGLYWSDAAPSGWRRVPPDFLTAAVRRFDGRIVAGGDGDTSFLLFRRPAEAAAFALSFHETLADQTLAGQEPASVRVGIHLGEVAPALLGLSGSAVNDRRLEGEAFDVVSTLARHALEGQTLLGRAAFDLARSARVPATLTAPDVRWMAHGAYLMDGRDEPLEIFEVGRDGAAPLAKPEDRSGLRRSVGLSEELALGWRPATGQPVPRRPGWRLAERLGEGGFGEVWLACRAPERQDGPEDRTGDKTREGSREDSQEERVFKFCFEPERLRALKREVTIFRLLRETLGHRDDIARVLDWDFEEMPYFLESEYTEGGDLGRWAERQGGLERVPLKIRLELVAEVAGALAAAHSVGVLHKDVKPQNVLVGHRSDGLPQARLTDFGVGLLTERDRLAKPGFTVLGFTEPTLQEDSSAGGTVQYMAPELHAGKPATVQADVYSLGVLLYQCAVGDLEHPLALGWHRQIDDELLEEDIAGCVDGDPERRFSGAGELAERLRSLEDRRAARRAEAKAKAARSRARRRRKLAARLGAVAAVLLVVISVFAFQTAQARDREQQAREQAEARRQQAETLIDFLLGDLRQELEPIGKLDILGKVGDEAMDYFAAVPEADLSPEELADYAKALHQIGQVRFSLGRVPQAAEAFQRSLDMADRLAASDPQNADRQFELGQSHFWVGFLRWQERDLGAALRQFEAYRDISRRLVERDPTNPTWRLELAYSHSNVGQILWELGELEKASSELGKSVGLLEGLISEGDDANTLRVELVHVYNKLAKVLESQGRIREALERYQTGLEVIRRASENEPEKVQLLRYLGHSYTYVGDLFRTLGDQNSALKTYESDLEIARRVAARDERNLVWREELVLRHNRLGRAYLVAGKTDLAWSQIEAAEAVTRTLLEDEASHPEWRLSAARNQWARALAELAEGRAESALRNATAAREILESLETEALPKLDRLLLAEVGAVLGDASAALGDTEEARASREAALRTARKLVADDRSPDHLAVLARLLLGLGRDTEAEPLMDHLDQMGYRRISYRNAIADYEAGGPS